jgi:hypothetical protein
MQRLCLCAALAAGLGATQAQAQATISYGPRLGLNVSSFSDSYPSPAGFTSETKAVGGLQIGGTANIALSANFAVQPSLIFSQKGAEMTATYTDRSNSPFVSAYKFNAKPTLNFLELPVNAVYTFGGEDGGFQIFAGPYVAWGVGGNGTAKGELSSDDPRLGLYPGSYPATLTVEYGDQQNDNANNTSSLGNLSATVTVRRFDAGFNAGVGYRKGPFQVQLGYGMGLVNFVPKDTDGNDTGSKAYHRVLQLSANYFFGGK